MDLHGLNPLELALWWADRGIRVLPVNGETKRPLVKEWQKAASTDPTQVHAWWRLYPKARVGLATGIGSYDVADFDVVGGKPGLQQLEILIDSGIIEPGTFMVVTTPSGGRHLWFRGTEQHNRQNVGSVYGVDLRAVGGMVLAPGNPGYRLRGEVRPPDELKTMEWAVLAACPNLIPEPQKPGRPQTQPQAAKPSAAAPRVQTRLVAPASGYENAAGEESPLDWYCNNHDLGQLLVADGWTFAYSSEGRDYYTRPGKQVRDGVSANVMLNADGRQTLINFSSTVAYLPTDRGISAAQWYGYRYHNGDMRGAAGEIRRRMMPQRERPQPRHLAAPPANQQAPAGMPVPPGRTESTPGAELVAVSEAGIPEPVRDFWRQRTELQEVWWQSQTGDVSPWAVLGTILACVAGRVGPHVALPPKGGVGAPTSLNLLVAISGNTGEGKGTSGQVARGFMGPPYPPWRKPGTGQGIAAMFTEQTKEGPVQSNDTVILNVAEIHNLGAHMSQQGATITSTLLEVYMAEELGEHYANKELRRPVREGRYRLALVAGVQPDNASILFDHAASGLPQRFIWLPAHWDDAVLPESGLVPPAPGPELGGFRAWPAILPGTLDDSLEATGWSPSDAAGGLQSPRDSKKKGEPEAVPAPVKDTLLVSYSPAVAKTIQLDQRRKRNLIKQRNANGEHNSGDPDSHLLLTRIKVAALLAIWLDHDTHISDEMWEMAGWVMWVSNDCRIKTHGRIRQKAQEKTAARAAAQIAQKAMVDEAADHQHNAVYIKACDRLVYLLEKIGGWVSVTQLRDGMASQEKKKIREAGLELPDILADLVQAGKVQTQTAERSGNRVVEYRTR